MDTDDKATDDDFDGWAIAYSSFYDTGSRIDREFRLSRKLVVTARRWTKFAEGLVRARTGQTRGRWETLFAIGFSDAPVTNNDLSERMNLQWPTLVRVLDALERDGLIVRTENKADKRSRLISLTDAGRRIVREIQPILDTARREVLSDLDDDELVLCEALLERIARRTNRWREAGKE